MKSKLCSVCLIMLLAFVPSACSSKKDRLLSGKWSLASQMIGGAPSSFWFKGGGDVIAPWEDRNFAMKSKGIYEFIDDTHMKITMKKGFYKGNTYFFDILELSENRLVLRTNYQKVKFKKVK